MTDLQFIIRFVIGLIGGYEEPRTRVGRPSLGYHEARLTARHFLETIPDKKHKKCVLRSVKLGSKVLAFPHGGRTVV
jgi:hypothetical protein